MTYTVEKESDHWLIMKSGAAHITVKSESLARAIAAMLNAFAEAKAEMAHETGDCCAVVKF
jgi:hypothetical protein